MGEVGTLQVTGLEVGEQVSVPGRRRAIVFEQIAAEGGGHGVVKV